MAETQNVPLINGVGYSWGQIVINILGSPIFGTNGINYSDAQEIENTYGAGNYPVERGFGPITFEGNITLHKKELILLQDIAPNKRIQEIEEFDIVVSYLNENRVVTDTIKNCRFKNNGVEVAQGDTAIATEIELAIGSIEFDA